MGLRYFHLENKFINRSQGGQYTSRYRCYLKEHFENICHALPPLSIIRLHNSNIPSSQASADRVDTRITWIAGPTVTSSDVY